MTLARPKAATVDDVLGRAQVICCDADIAITAYSSAGRQDRLR
jgi:hypothetical protein